jgi:hypothetical protein
MNCWTALSPCGVKLALVEVVVPVVASELLAALEAPALDVVWAGLGPK